jgi:hypothetical protein
MKKSDLYELAIKILGLYLILSVINQLQSLFFNFAYYMQSESRPEQFGYIDQKPLFIVSLISFLVLTIFTILLIFRSRQITKLICQASDYKQEVVLFTSKKSVYEIALILFGLIILINTVPDFTYKLKGHIQDIQNNVPAIPDNIAYLITTGLKITVGIISLFYSDQISNYFSKLKST